VVQLTPLIDRSSGRPHVIMELFDGPIAGDSRACQPAYLRDLGRWGSVAPAICLIDFSERKQLSDLSVLAGVGSIQTLNLTFCEHLSGDLSALASGRAPVAPACAVWPQLHLVRSELGSGHLIRRWKRCRSNQNSAAGKLKKPAAAANEEGFAAALLPRR
jgi:hypothetical protein